MDATLQSIIEIALQQGIWAALYSNPDLRNVKAPADPQPTIDVALLIQQLQNSPELATALAALLPHTS